MSRIVLSSLVLALAPFIGYWVWWLAVRRTPKGMGTATKRHYLTLLIFSGLLIIAGLIRFGYENPSHTGRYHPAEFRDGVFHPGGFDD
jgi:hypothetical protein